MKNLRLGYLSTMYHTSHMIKNLKWIEEELEITPEWNMFGTGPSMVNAFREGALDVGYIGLPPAMIAIEKGLPLKCIAGGHVEGTVMIGRKEFSSSDSSSTGDVLKRFAGKKIGTPSSGSIHDVIARFLIKESGAENIEVTNYPWADLIPDAIKASEIDGAFGTPPLSVVADKWFGYSVIIPASRIWPFNPSCGIVVTEKTLKEKQLLKDFLCLHEKACNLVIENPKEAAKITSDEIRVVDSSFVQKVFSVSPRYCAALPEEYINATTAFMPALKNMAYIDRDLSIEEIFDFSLIEEVHPEPHHYLKPLSAC
jgi:NitT/TauT family transport system substrate-binding protein